MKAPDVRALSTEDLSQQLEGARKELFTLRFKHVTRQLENPNLVRAKRRDIARMQTILRQRQLGR